MNGFLRMFRRRPTPKAPQMAVDGRWAAGRSGKGHYWIQTGPKTAESLCKQLALVSSLRFGIVTECAECRSAKASQK